MRHKKDAHIALNGQQVYTYSVGSRVNMMSGTLTILNTAGAVALLLFAVRMVRTGVDRAYGPALRRSLQRASSSRVGAASTGVVMAICLQGSTAVALLISGAAASGLISSPAALSVLLGADLGSALVVRVLSFEISSLIPFLLLVGVALFLASRMRSARQAGRIIIGIALILVALQMIGIASEPLRESKAATAFIAFFAREPVTAFLIAALATWFLHSSIAALLVVASFAGNGLLPVELALILVLGINAGSGIIAALLTKNHEREIWLIPLSNLFIRAVLAVVFLAAIIVLGTDRFVPDMAPDAIVISGHILFNVVVVAAGLPAVRPVLMIVDKFVPPDRDSPSADLATEQQHRSSLDPNMVKEPKQAIGNAMREILTMSNTVSMMLHGVLDALSKGSKAEISGIAKLDDDVDQQHAKIKNYLTLLARQKLSPAEARRCADLMTFCVRLEQAGDIIVKNLLALARKKQALELTFSKQGWRELRELHECVASNLQRALNVLVSADAESARDLIEEKLVVRQLEQASTSRHLERLRKQKVESIETSEIHLDAVRDLVQINTLVTSVAYPILEESGELLDSRLASARP